MSTMSSRVSLLMARPRCEPSVENGEKRRFPPTVGGQLAVDRFDRLLDGLEALGEAAGMALLGPGESLEPLRDLFEALVAGGLGEARVHLGVLVGLAGDGRLEVVGGGPDRLAGGGVAHLGEEVEVAERVAGLAFGDRAEQGSDVGVALDVGLLREVEVT